MDAVSRAHRASFRPLAEAEFHGLAMTGSFEQFLVLMSLSTIGMGALYGPIYATLCIPTKRFRQWGLQKSQ